MPDKKEKRIQVVHPDGRTGSIPASRLDKAMAAGFKRRFTVRTQEEEVEAAPFSRLLKGASKFAGEFGVPVAGAIVGAERGRKLLAPLGPRAQIGGAAIGAGIGAFSGSLAGEASLGRKPSVQRASEFGIGASVGEVVPGISRAIRPAKIPGVAQGLEKASTEADQLGIFQTRSQRTQRSFVSSIENISRRALFGAKSRFLGFDKQVNRQLRKAADNIAKGLSDISDDAERAKFLQESLEQAEVRAGEIIQQGKKNLFDKIGNQQVVLKRSEITHLLAQLKRGL
ncbi:hypothetical protein LCGC14_2275560, partial [marine sediment metagenome]